MQGGNRDANSSLCARCGLLPGTHQFIRRVRHHFPGRGWYQFLRFELCELGRRQSADARTRTAIVVIITPRLDDRARLSQAQEYMLVKTLAAQAAI